MRNSRRLLCQSFLRSTLVPLIVGLSLLNTACGLKGKLYLPDEKPREVSPIDQASGKRRTPPKPVPPEQEQEQKQEQTDDGTQPGDTTAPTPPSDSDPSATPPPPAGT